ncbi:MAG: hypothetical protein ACC642_09395 [Pseudomonadales bacterium]
MYQLKHPFNNGTTHFQAEKAQEDQTCKRLKRVFNIDIELCPRQQAPPRQPPIRVTGPITAEIQFDAS